MGHFLKAQVTCFWGDECMNLNDIEDIQPPWCASLSGQRDLNRFPRTFVVIVYCLSGSIHGFA